MRFEVALLRWTEDADGEGVRLVGRSRDLNLVELVQAHLIRQLGEEIPANSNPSGVPGLRVVRDDQGNGSEPERES